MREILLTSDLIDGEQELSLILECLLVVHAGRYYLEVVVAALADQLLRGLALHLLLQGVPRLIVEEPMGVPRPSDPLHQTRVVLNVDVVVLGLLQLVKLLGVLIGDRARGAQC